MKIIVKTIFFGADTAGYPTIMVAVLFLGGVQLFFLGLLGEYIGRIYMEVKNRPIYWVAKESGFVDGDADVDHRVVQKRIKHYAR